MFYKYLAKRLILRHSKYQIIKTINLNGEILCEDQPIFSVHNRAFKYGDSLFESMRMTEGDIPLWLFHYDRLMLGMKALRFEFSNNFNSKFLFSEIKKLTKEIKNARIRLTIFRTDGGLYTPISNECQFLIEVEKFQKKHFPKNEEGLKIGWYDEIPVLSKTRLAGMKSGNALTYVMAGVHRKTYQFDDCILFNEKKNIAESISSNLFLWTDETLVTPALSSGCVAGVMRRTLIEITQELGLNLLEVEDLTPKSLFQAEGILLTNAVQGVKWVKEVEHVQFVKPAILEDLQAALNSYQCPER